MSPKSQPQGPQPWHRGRAGHLGSLITHSKGLKGGQAAGTKRFSLWAFPSLQNSALHHPCSGEQSS